MPLADVLDCILRSLAATIGWSWPELTRRSIRPNELVDRTDSLEVASFNDFFVGVIGHRLLRLGLGAFLLLVRPFLLGR